MIFSRSVSGFGSTTLALSHIHQLIQDNLRPFLPISVNLPLYSTESSVAAFWYPDPEHGTFTSFFNDTDPDPDPDADPYPYLQH
jgi:hypothetical protein